MTNNPDPTEAVLHCQTCGEVVFEDGETVQRGAWIRRENDHRPDDRELLCFDCAIDERWNPDTESRADVRGNFLSGIYDTPDPRLDRLVEHHDDFEPIDGTDAATSLGVSLATFGECVEVDPRFEFGVSPRSPWVDMVSYRNFHDHDLGENTPEAR